MSSQGTVIPFSPAHHAHLVPYIAALHASCVTHDRTIATFLPPLSHEKLLSWWKDRIAEVSAGSRLICILIRDHSAPGRDARASQKSPGPDSGSGHQAIKGTDVLGVVMLAMPYSESEAFRATVEKLLVHTTHRRKGAARALMAAVEEEAFQRGKTLLTLDLESGSTAETLYRKLGYTEVGKIPNYGLSPSGELKDGTLFYKHLTT